MKRTWEAGVSGQFDVIILGQGLAGTALAWALRWDQARVLVVDREAGCTASKIAAGLMTPVTGQKLVLSWRYHQLFATALSFYRRIETETESNLFAQTAMVRLFKNQEEITVLSQRCVSGDLGKIVREPFADLDRQSFDAKLGGFEMAPAGRLDVPRYLRASRQTFEAAGGYLASEIDVSRDISLTDDAVHLPRLSVSARRLIFCQGIDAIGNPWFPDVRFKPAKGEILTLRIPGLQEKRVVHRGIWLAPLGGDLFKAGATYDWSNLDTIATSKGRDEIIAKLREFLRLPFEVVCQEAAVRPVHRNQFPVMGFHPTHPQLGFFNGFGSKASLQAPHFALHFAAVLSGREPIDPVVDLNRKMTWPPDSRSGHHGQHDGTVSMRHVKLAARKPLTEQAQDVVREVLESGETAIDATAGNGHDTHFLARHVGPTGQVFAFDVQQSALDATRHRLSASGFQNVDLIRRDHSQLSGAIPIEKQGRVGAIMFNLGYLPSGDKQITTNPATTRPALLQASEMLRPGGVLTILAYTGHDGGAAEAAAVAAILDELPKPLFQIMIHESSPGRTSGPRLFVARRLSPLQDHPSSSQSPNSSDEILPPSQPSVHL